MDIFKNSKIMAGLVIVVVLVLGYFAYASLSTPSTATTIVQESPASQNLLLALSNLHTIKLNGAIFSDPAFQSLSDFGVTIPPQPTGRRNPFAPLGSPGPSTQTTTQTSGKAKTQ